MCGVIVHIYTQLWIGAKLPIMPILIDGTTTQRVVAQLMRLECAVRYMAHCAASIERLLILEDVPWGRKKSISSFIFFFFINHFCIVIIAELKN